MIMLLTPFSALSKSEEAQICEGMAVAFASKTVAGELAVAGGKPNSPKLVEEVEVAIKVADDDGNEDGADILEDCPGKAPRAA